MYQVIPRTHITVRVTVAALTEADPAPSSVDAVLRRFLTGFLAVPGSHRHVTAVREPPSIAPQLLEGSGRPGRRPRRATRRLIVRRAPTRIRTGAPVGGRHGDDPGATLSLRCPGLLAHS